MAPQLWQCAEQTPERVREQALSHMRQPVGVIGDAGQGRPAYNTRIDRESWRVI